MAIFNDKFQYRIRAEKNKDTKDAPKGWSEASKTNGKYNIKLNLTTIKNTHSSIKNVLQHEISHSFDSQFKLISKAKQKQFPKRALDSIINNTHAEYIAKVMPNVNKVKAWGMNMVQRNKSDGKKSFQMTDVGGKKNLPFVKKALKQYGESKFNKELSQANNTVVNEYFQGGHCSTNAQMSRTYNKIGNMAEKLKNKKK